MRADEGDKGRPGAASGLSGLSGLAGLAYHRSSDLVERVLATAREQLGMEVAFVSEFAEGRTVFRSLEGDAESFGFREGVGTPLEDSFCRRVVEGRVPSVVPDSGQDEAVRDLGITREANIGSYVGIPIQFSDGRLYGTMCCMSHSPDPALRERDTEFMVVLARLIADQLEREELESENRRLEMRATGAGALDSALNKPGPLDGGERALMREHPAIGERIVASTEGLAHLAPLVRAEHERWDGGGYPDGLSGESLPLARSAGSDPDRDPPFTASTGFFLLMGRGERRPGRRGRACRG